MKGIIFFSELLLLLTAAIWGFAFVAQRVGMNYIRPFTYNGIRFLLGAITLIPVFVILNKKSKLNKNNIQDDKIPISKNDFYGILITGVVLFIAANLQQIGIVYTSAGNAGFITGLYVIIVPFLSIILRKKTDIIYFISAIVSFIGLYLLSSEGRFIINKGDIIVAIGAIFWAIHILIISHFSNRINNLILAIGQFLICGILSMIMAFIIEIKDKNIIEKIFDAKYPILYGGILSISVAYTLQIVGQRKAHPALASIIMSLESFFAFVGGILILKESTNIVRIVGAILMLSALFLSQLKPNKRCLQKS
ncbi:MAG: DMT family transporter [Exilispira sp.]|jgi:drug/metabolite transporter (DMT)-like permease|nr:DMT family transporter [Exilispira sp.]